MRRKASLVLAAAMIIPLVFLTACGTMEDITINDGMVKTELEVRIPNTVDKILEEAEISLYDGDETVPALEAEISEPQEIQILRKHTVKLTIDGETKTVTMVGGTVQDLLDQEGIQLDENQHADHEMNEYLKEGMELNIFYEYPITVLVDGETIEDSVDAITVGETLEQFGIVLGENDRVNPGMDKDVTSGMVITVNRVTTETVVETEEIDYETIRKKDKTIKKGKEVTETEGEKGEKAITYEVTMVDGKEESRKMIKEEITKEPVNEVIKVGTKVKKKAQSPSGKTVVSKKAVYDCDGSGHGYYEITYSDGSVEYVEF